MFTEYGVSKPWKFVRGREETSVSGRLVRVLEEWGGVEREVVAIYQVRRHLSAKVKLFVDFLQEQFREQRPW